jgi:hypothetical protein
MARAHVRLSSISQRLFIRLKRSFPPLLTVTNFWERASSTREYMMLLLIAFMLTVLQ